MTMTGAGPISSALTLRRKPAMVVAGCCVASIMRAVARPDSAIWKRGRPRVSSARYSALSTVVLPTPAPPVMILKRFSNEAFTASRCALFRANSGMPRCSRSSRSKSLIRASMSVGKSCCWVSGLSNSARTNSAHCRSMM
ncbi:hypothetical protein D3C78_1060590 [compost metagenome]